MKTKALRYHLIIQVRHRRGAGDKTFFTPWQPARMPIISAKSQHDMAEKMKRRVEWLTANHTPAEDGWVYVADTWRWALQLK